MGRYIEAVCRLCRRQGQKLFLKGNRCNTEKCAITKRAFPPGQHGKTSRSKLSNYGLQMKEKQKVKRMYGILERQFRKYFEDASRKKGVTGKVLLQTLERRIDNVIFRMGLATSRPQARQIVRHNMVSVNGRRTNIPSFLVDVNDAVAITTKEKALKKIKENLEGSKDRTVPTWIDFNAAGLSGVIKRLPEKQDIDQLINEQLIVELYSK